MKPSRSTKTASDIKPGNLGDSDAAAPSTRLAPSRQSQLPSWFPSQTDVSAACPTTFSRSSGRPDPSRIDCHPSSGTPIVCQPAHTSRCALPRGSPSHQAAGSDGESGFLRFQKSVRLPDQAGNPILGSRVSQSRGGTTFPYHVAGTWTLGEPGWALEMGGVRLRAGRPGRVLSARQWEWLAVENRAQSRKRTPEMSSCAMGGPLCLLSLFSGGHAAGCPHVLT